MTTIQTRPRSTASQPALAEGILFDLPYDNGRRACLITREMLEYLDAGTPLDEPGQLDAYARHAARINDAAVAQISAGDGAMPVVLQQEFFLGGQS